MPNQIDATCAAGSYKHTTPVFSNLFFHAFSTFLFQHQPSQLQLQSHSWEGPVHFYTSVGGGGGGGELLMMLVHRLKRRGRFSIVSLFFAAK